MRMELIPPVEMKKLDKQILSILQQNARVSISNLSRQLNRPKPTILYHMNRLENEKVIREYRTHFALFKPYVQYALVFLHFNHSSIEETREALMKDPHCFTLFSAGGTYNTVMGIAYAPSTTPDEIIRSLEKKHPVARSEWHQVEEHVFFPLNYSEEKIPVYELPRQKEKSFHSTFNHSSKKNCILFSPEDIRLLRAISNNARSSLKGLEDETKLGKQKIKRRIAELIQSGIIIKFSASVNPYAFEGMTMALLLARTGENDPESLRQLIARHCAGNGFVKLTRSHWNAAAMLHFRSQSEMATFENKLHDSSQGITDYQLNLVNQQYGLNWFPRVVEETLVSVRSNPPRKEL